MIAQQAAADSAVIARTAKFAFEFCVKEQEYSQTLNEKDAKHATSMKMIQHTNQAAAKKKASANASTEAINDVDCKRVMKGCGSWNSS